MCAEYLVWGRYAVLGCGEKWVLYKSIESRIEGGGEEWQAMVVSKGGKGIGRDRGGELAGYRIDVC